MGERVPASQSDTQWSNWQLQHAINNEKESIRRSWGVYDSPLEPGIIFGRGASFSDTFSVVVPEEEASMRTDIEHTLSSVKGDVIGIEYGGPASKLFSGFQKGTFTRTLGLTLVDVRSSRQKRKDKERNHEIIPGDMTTPEVQAKIAEWLGGEKPSLIIERMKRGLSLLPKNAEYHANLMAGWYGMLREGGLMYIQASDTLNLYLKTWAQSARLQSDDTVNVLVGYYDNAINGSVRLEKKLVLH